MNEAEAVRFIAEIQENGMREADEIKSYLYSKMAEPESGMVQILQIAVARAALPWEIVRGCMLDCAAKTDEFFGLIVEACEYYETPECLELLKELYAKDPETAIWLIERLEKSDGDAMDALARLYGAMGQSEPDKFLGVMDKPLSDAQKMAYVGAIQLAYPDGKAPARLVGYVVSLSASRTPEIREAAIRCMLRALLGSKRARDHLRRLAENEDNDKISIAEIPRHAIMKHKKFALELLKLCSETEDPEIRRVVAGGLAACAPEYTLECAVIAKRWLKSMEPLQDRFDHDLEEMVKGRLDKQWSRDAVPLYGPIDILLKGIGECRLDKIRQFMASWIRDAETSRFERVRVPYAVAVIYQKNETEIIKLLEAIDRREARSSILVLSILKRFLNEGYKNASRSDAFYTYAEKVVPDIAKQFGINLRPTQGLGRFMQLLDFIRQIECPKNVNAKDVLNSLKRFKNLSRIIRKKLENMIRDEHPLAVLLSSASPDPKIQKDPNHSTRRARQQGCAYAAVSEIDASLELLKDCERISRMRDGLTSGTEFFGTFAELVVAARLKKKFPVTLQPPVGKHKLDIEAEIGGSSVLFEVFRPNMNTRLEYVEKMHGVRNTIRCQIVKKIREQIKHARGTGCPVVLVVDGSDALEINGWNIVDSLFGTKVLKTRFNKGVAVGPARPGRAKDSIYDRTPDARVISAVMLVRTCCNGDMKMEISGELFRAPDPAVPLDARTEDAIKKAVLGAA